MQKKSVLILLLVFPIVMGIYLTTTRKDKSDNIEQEKHLQQSNLSITSDNEKIRKVENLKGVFLELTPSKSIASYCATFNGNSYILKTENNQEILLDLSLIKGQVQDYINQQVEIQGSHFTKAIVSEDDNMQRPVEPQAPMGFETKEVLQKETFDCKLFQVLNIRLL